MDAFYAAVEQRDDPTLQGLPIAVGGGGDRGVVMTASYEARKFGVRSAMPGFKARRLCPDLIFVRSRFDAYKEASRQIRGVFELYSDLVEPLSLDEAYLDVSKPKGGIRPAMDIAGDIKTDIFNSTGLTASAGVSFNKFLAKIASDLDKPDGLSVIRPEAALGFLAKLPVEQFHGVGPATGQKLREAGFCTGADLQACQESELVARLGRIGGYVWRMAHAQDERKVESKRQRKSLSVETTFRQDSDDRSIIAEEIRKLCQELAKRLQHADFHGRTLTLKLKYADFRIRSRSTTLDHAVLSEDLTFLASQLLDRDPLEGRVRLVGVGISGAETTHPGEQFELPFNDD